MVWKHPQPAALCHPCQASLHRRRLDALSHLLVASLADDFEWLHLFELLQIDVPVALSVLELILVVVHIEKLLAFAELNLEKLFVAWVDPMLPRLELRVLALVLEHCLDSIPPPLIGDPVPELEQVGDLFDHLSLQSWGTLCEQELHRFSVLFVRRSPKWVLWHLPGLQSTAFAVAMRLGHVTIEILTIDVPTVVTHLV